VYFLRGEGGKVVGGEVAFPEGFGGEGRVLFYFLLLFAEEVVKVVFDKCHFGL
jgi:hypothetical protein